MSETIGAEIRYFFPSLALCMLYGKEPSWEEIWLVGENAKFLELTFINQSEWGTSQGEWLSGLYNMNI